MIQDVKAWGLTPRIAFKTIKLEKREESGISSVVVKCVDIRKRHNTSGEGGFLTETDA